MCQECWSAQLAATNASELDNWIHTRSWFAPREETLPTFLTSKERAYRAAAKAEPSTSDCRRKWG